jgi:hypothetical protein
MRGNIVLAVQIQSLTNRYQPDKALAPEFCKLSLDSKIRLGTSTTQQQEGHFVDLAFSTILGMYICSPILLPDIVLASNTHSPKPVNICIG